MIDPKLWWLRNTKFIHIQKGEPYGTKNSEPDPENGGKSYQKTNSSSG